MTNKNFMQVSVPCRGAMFLNTVRSFDKSSIALVSVPCRGAMFLNSSNTNVGMLGESLFPSPVVELCFSIDHHRFLDCPF